MNAYLAAVAAGSAAFVYWNIAAVAADRRRLSIGTLPALLPLVAATTSGAAAIAGAHPPATVACAGVAVAAWVDARTGSIFDPLTASVFLASFVLCAIDGAAGAGSCGAAVVGAALLLVHAITGGHGLGLGDVKLGSALGMALGASAGLTAIGLAFIFGGVYGTWLLATKRAHAQTAIRFGPFVAAGTFTALALPLGLQQ